MSFFKMQTPRGFQHSYIYVDERKEKLKKIEERAKRELGMLPPKPFEPQDIKGSFVEGTKHLKDRKENGKPAVSYQKLIIGILICFFFLHYLLTGNWLL